MSSIGSIGSADGPTRVFVSGPSLSFWLALAAAVLIVFTVFMILRHKRRK